MPSPLPSPSIAALVVMGAALAVGCSENAASPGAAPAKATTPRVGGAAAALERPSGAAAEAAASAAGAGSAAAPAAPAAAGATPSAAALAAGVEGAPSGPSSPSSGEPLGGAGVASGAAGPGGAARIYSKARFAWINPAPRPMRGWIGYLGLGGSVALRGGSAEAARTPGPGCDAWYAVEPQGYVCAGETATVDADDPAVAALRRDAPRAGPWPYEYAESIGAPRYPKIPTEAEQRAMEWDLDAHLDKVARASAATGEEALRAIDKDLVGVDLTPAGVGPPELFPFGALVREARKRVVTGSTVAFTRAFDAGGRTWVVSSDQAIMPKDRMKPYPRSSFEGVWLKDGIKLPLAFFRGEARPRYKKGEGGAMEASGEPFPRLAWVGLTGRGEGEGKRRFLETTEPGVFVLESDAVVIREANRAPFTRGPEEGAAPRKWLDVSVLGGWLVAYEEQTPVFATLISPGRGGIPTDGVPPIETAATPTGTFRVDGKFVTATMVSSTNDSIVHSEVQYVQNFHGPHALHGAYWHNAWGEPKSGGCVNLSPIDAMRMFAWTDPPMPEGWHGLRAVRAVGRSTVVKVHR